MAAASLPSGLHTPPLADLVRLFSSATLTGYVRRQEAPSFARETAGCLPFWYDMSRRDHPDAGCADTPNTRCGFPACERQLPYSGQPTATSKACALYCPEVE